MSVRKKIDRNRTSRLGKEIKEIKEYLFASRSKRTALIDGEKRISFEELYQKAVVVSQNLKRERRCVVALFLQTEPNLSMPFTEYCYPIKSFFRSIQSLRLKN